MKRFFIGVIAIVILLMTASVASAYVAASSNFKLEKDSINFSGTDFSTSSSFTMHDTLGEIISGITNGSNYNASSGYRYMEAETGTPAVTRTSGCKDLKANNYNASYDDADNAKCTYDPIIITGDVLGCLDSRANNYNSNATVDNESCTYDIIVNPVLPPVVGGGGGGVFGCIDSQARNYNPLATKDDKSCEYSPFFSTTTENITQPSKLWDFRFLQPKEPTKTFDKQMRVWVIGAKDLTILFNYDLAPATLKTIGVTLTDSTDKTKTFSFLMHRNADGTAYEATVSPLLRAGTYPIDIYIINYDNQATKRIKGTLIVSGTGISPIVPIAVATGLAISFLPSLYDLLVILGQIFGYFFGRRKNENPWGTVYDSVTKQPLDPVYLTVAQDGKEISTAITDIDGRFSFFLPAGVYTIKANKTHYRFPSERLLGKTNDELYDHLYFGDQFTTNGEAIINLNIPMDPLDFDWNEFAKTKTNFFEFYNRRHLWFSRIYKLVFGSGLLLSIYAFLMSPSWWNMVVLVLYLGLIAINRFWRNRHKPLQIIDRSTGEPLPFAIIRVFLPDLNQQIKYVVADKLGRFYLLVRPGVYYYTVEEKQPDGSYLKVFQSNSINLPKGILTNDIYVK